MFKLHGERNSGTNFLTELFEKNFAFSCFQEFYEMNNCYYWKHGAPLPKRNDKQIDIFIIRELDNWLLSMYHKPYHLENKLTFHQFLTEKQIPNDTWTKDGFTNKPINHTDFEKNIFEIRYFKLDKILEYVRENTNTILVRLEYIQNPANCKLFLEAINKIYNLNKHTEFITSLPYVKNTGEKLNIRDYTDIIASKKNKTHEDFINKLTFIINYSPN